MVVINKQKEKREREERQREGSEREKSEKCAVEEEYCRALI